MRWETSSASQSTATAKRRCSSARHRRTRTPRDGFVAGWQGFLAWGATFLFGLGQSIPALVVLALLALIALLIVRRIMKRMPARTEPVQGAKVVNPVTATAKPAAPAE